MNTPFRSAGTLSLTNIENVEGLGLGRVKTTHFCEDLQVWTIGIGVICNLFSKNSLLDVYKEDPPEVFRLWHIHFFFSRCF